MTGQWSAADVPTMWESAQQADTAIAWRQVTGWQTTYELLDQHQAQLRRCREELSVAWPPERSPAARAFLDYLDALLVSMDRAKQDALANRTALAGVLTSLSTAKHDMAAIKAKWDGYADEEATFRGNQVELVQLSGGPNWRDKLNDEGRARMNQSDQEIFESTQQMTIPTPFVSFPIQDETRDFGIATNPSDGPNMGASLGQEVRPAGIAIPQSSEIDVSHSSMTMAGRTDGGESSVSSIGLAGQVVDGSAIGAPSELGAVASGASSVSIPLRTTSEGMPIFVPSGGNSSWRTLASGERGLASRTGGPVGGQDPESASRPRVNPVGGVVGSDGPSSPQGSSLVGSPVRRRDENRRRQAESGQYREWWVRRGGPSVLEPRPEPSYGPGAGVIGIDR